jgi:hypothetical protein
MQTIIDCVSDQILLFEGNKLKNVNKSFLQLFSIKATQLIDLESSFPFIVEEEEEEFLSIISQCRDSQAVSLALDLNVSQCYLAC